MTALFVAGLYQTFDVSEIPQMKILYKQLIFFQLQTKSQATVRWL
jgi:hypothetical protein